MLPPSAAMSHFILGTAGHIDHGKSSLVRALTGTDPDRLPEEKARGMTITLGFARLELAAGGRRFEVGVVDVPGHADFIRQMVFGAMGIDLALLIVAADDGWMPQTEEHVQILEYLGVRHAVVALTKADLAEDPAFAAEFVREELAGTAFATAPVIPVSAPRGEGLDELRAALAAALAAIPPKADLGKPRLACDRAFSPRGIGTVVTGTLTGGVLRRGQALLLMPEGLAVGARSLQSHGQAAESVPPGSRTAVNLSDVELAEKGKPGARRGQLLTLPRFSRATRVLDVELWRGARDHPQLPAPPPPRDRQRVAVHHAGAVVAARLLLGGGQALAPGERRLARLRLEQPLLVFAGDRLLLRDAGLHHTLAGALVLDPFPPECSLQQPARQAQLAARAAALARADAAGFLRAELEARKIISLEDAAGYSTFGDAAIEAAVAELESAGIAARAGARVLHRPWWEESLRVAAEMVLGHHRKKSEEPGLPLDPLRRALGPAATDKRIFDAFLDELAAHGFVREGPLVRHRDHHPKLAPALEAIAAKIRAAVTAKPLDPPLKRDLAPDPAAQKVLRFLCKNGELIDLDERAVIHREGFEQVRAGIVAHLRAHPGARAADLRDAAGMSRKLLMPILEKLDAEGTTVRDGDFRRLPEGA
jgi:selenocysteine-specific elongation factor